VDVVPRSGSVRQRNRHSARHKTQVGLGYLKKNQPSRRVEMGLRIWRDVDVDLEGVMDEWVIAEIFVFEPGLRSRTRVKN
jgi:hypothetical protein